jgi:cellulose synthase/poly-beta-1,6-N-acetylglucosamine synthase-like glycosyltransferase
MSQVFFILAGVFLLLVLHPYTFYPLSLTLMPKRPLKKPEPGWTRPSVAICMSAYNEERVIVAKVESLLEMAKAYGPVSIHIYVDGSEDRTVELLEPYRDRVQVVASKARSGKTVGLKALVAGANSDLIAFTDANVEVPPSALINLVEALQDPDVCLASARLTYNNRVATGASTSGAIYWNIEEFIKSLETATGSLIGVDGALFVIERSSYVAPPDALIDDLYVSMQALLGGKRVVSAQSVLVAERGAISWTEEFDRKARIACQGMNVHRAIWPKLVKAPPVIIYCYLSHRFLKWLTPFNLVLTGAFFYAGLAVTFGPAWPTLIASLSFIGLTLGAWFNLPYCRTVAAAFAALAGVATGQIEALMGRTYTTWSPAPSVRDQD